MNCLVLILSLPVSHTGYLSSLLDLIIECVGHKSTRIVMLSLFILIKYYQFALTPKQNDRLYNILFSLIMTTYQDDILLLIAYLLSLLPQYHLLIVRILFLLQCSAITGHTFTLLLQGLIQQSSNSSLLFCISCLLLLLILLTIMYILWFIRFLAIIVMLYTRKTPSTLFFSLLPSIRTAFLYLRMIVRSPISLFSLR